MSASGALANIANLPNVRFAPSTINLVVPSVGIAILPARMQHVRPESVAFVKLSDIALRAQLGIAYMQTERSNAVRNLVETALSLRARRLDSSRHEARESQRVAVRMTARLKSCAQEGLSSDQRSVISWEDQLRTKWVRHQNPTLSHAR
jgi:hypothetical protein